MKKDLIFCIGYNKTGTTSLYQSIVDLGFINYPRDMMGIAEFIMADVVIKKWYGKKYMQNIQMQNTY